MPCLFLPIITLALPGISTIFGSPAIGNGKPARSQRPSRFFGEITTLFRKNKTWSVPYFLGTRNIQLGTSKPCS